MERHYPPELTTVEARAHQAGVKANQLTVLKTRIADIHYLKPEERKMPGVSPIVLGVAMELSVDSVGDIDFDIMNVITAFAEVYHRWTVNNEYLASIDAFESSLPFHFPNLKASEIREIKQTVEKVAVKFADPDNILHLHHMLIRHVGGKTIERVRHDLKESIANYIKSRHNLLVSPLDQPHD